MTIVLNSAGDILGGYMPDKWQGSEFIRHINSLAQTFRMRRKNWQNCSIADKGHNIMKRKNMKYKIFWSYDDGSKEFPKNTSLSEMSACYQWVSGKNKARFRLRDKRIYGNSVEKAYRFVGTTYDFTITEVY